MRLMNLGRKLAISFLVVCMTVTVAYGEEDETVQTPTVTQQADETAQTPKATQETEEKPATPTARQETIDVEKGGVLVQKRKLIVEPGVQYSHTSRARLAINGFTILQAIVLGKIVSEDVKKDVIMPFINLRYGVTDNLQFEMKVPYLFRRDRQAYESNNETHEYTVRDDDIGDIEAGMYYHLIHERENIPDVVINLRGKSKTGKDPYDLDTEYLGADGGTRLKELPTGSGHYGLSAGVTVAKTSDPAVLFGTLAYYYNFERDVGSGYGDVKPGDSIEVSLGMAYALNEKLSTSLSYQQRYYFKTEQNGHDLADTDFNVATMNFGVNYGITERVSFSVSVGIGLTNDAADTTVEIRLPIRF